MGEDQQIAEIEEKLGTDVRHLTGTVGGLGMLDTSYHAARKHMANMTSYTCNHEFPE